MNALELGKTSESMRTENMDEPLDTIVQIRQVLVAVLFS